MKIKNSMYNCHKIYCLILSSFLVFINMDISFLHNYNKEQMILSFLFS